MRVEQVPVTAREKQAVRPGSEGTADQEAVDLVRGEDWSPSGGAVYRMRLAFGTAVGNNRILVKKKTTRNQGGFSVLLCQALC